VPRRNFHAFHEHAQVPLAKRGAIRQTNFEGTERSIAAIFEFIDDVNVNAALRRARNANLRLPIGKFIARAKGTHAARREKSPRGQGGRKNDSRAHFRKQDDVILPGRRLRVKSCVATITGRKFLSRL
jgi:hypothetical protein